MATSRDSIVESFFALLIDQGKLSEREVGYILKGKYSNLNKVAGSKHLTCMYPNCGKVGVKKSHLFAATFLRHFAEGGKLYTKSFFPKFNGPNFDYYIEELGIGQALTFPGFCEDCEQKFSFEPKGKIDQAEDYFLQLLRAVCYDKRILELEMSANEAIVNTLRQQAARKVNPLFTNGKFRFISIKGVNKIETFFTEREKIHAIELQKMTEIYDRFTKIQNGQPALNIVSLRVPIHFHFFVSYIGDLTWNRHGLDFQSNLILNICPIDKEFTDLFFVDLNDQLTQERLSNFDAADVMLLIGELTCCSQTWLANKAYWHNLSNGTRQEILRNRRVPQQNNP